MKQGSSADLLVMMHYDDLTRLAARLEINRETGALHPTKDHLATAISRVIDDPERVTRTCESLTTEQLLDLSRWVWFYGRTPYGLNRIPDRARYMERLAGLAETGLILQYPSRYGLPTFGVPPAAEKVISARAFTLYLQGAPPNIVRSHDALSDVALSPGPLAVTELVRILGSLHRKPARLTQRGLVYKKDAEAFDGLFHPLRPRDVSRAWAALEGAFGIPESASGLLLTPYHTRLEVALKVLEAADLLEDDGGLLAAAPGWEEWWTGGLAEAWFNVVDLAAPLIELNCPQAAKLLGVLVDDAAWVRPASFFKDVIHLPAQTSELQGVGLGIRALSWLGLIDIAIADEEPVIRLNEEARAMLLGKEDAIPSEAAFIVQPGGQVLAPPRLNPFIQARLEEVADIERVDTASTYHLSQTRVWAELEQGADKESIRSFLESGSKGGLPQAVAYDVNAWIMRYSRVAFAELTALYCEDEALLTRLLELPSAARFLVGRLGPHHAIVREGRVESLRKALASAGFHVARQADHPGKVSDIKAPHPDRRMIDGMIGDLVSDLGSTDETEN